eukprot:s1396_g12.t1
MPDPADVTPRAGRSKKRASADDERRQQPTSMSRRGYTLPLDKKRCSLVFAHFVNVSTSLGVRELTSVEGAELRDAKDKFKRAKNMHYDENAEDRYNMMSSSATVFMKKARELRIVSVVTCWHLAASLIRRELCRRYQLASLPMPRRAVLENIERKERQSNIAKKRKADQDAEKERRAKAASSAQAGQDAEKERRAKAASSAQADAPSQPARLLEPENPPTPKAASAAACTCHTAQVSAQEWRAFIKNVARVVASETSALTEPQMVRKEYGWFIFHGGAASKQLEFMIAAGLRETSRGDDAEELPSNSPVQPEDSWQTGSITKSMTATLAAVLQQKNLLSSQVTVAEALMSDSQLRNVSAESGFAHVTLEQLLTHRGGAWHAAEFVGPEVHGVTAPCPRCDRAMSELGSSMRCSGDDCDWREYRRWKLWAKNRMRAMDKLPKDARGSFIWTLLSGKALP